MLWRFRNSTLDVRYWAFVVLNDRWRHSGTRTRYCVERLAALVCRNEKINLPFMKTKIGVLSAGLFVATMVLLCIGSNKLLAAESNSKSLQFIYVGGEVKVPQRYVYSDDLTLGKAIKLAKGVTSKASDKVILTRQGSDEQTFRLKAVQKGDAANVKLKPGDKVFVPRK